MVGEQRLFRLFDGEKSHLSAHSGKAFQKAFQTVSGLDVIEQSADKDSRASKCRLTRHNLRVANDNRIHTFYCASLGFGELFVQLGLPVVILFLSMSNSVLAPLFEKGSGDRSVVAGISEEFDFLAELEKAKSIRIATAFGHLSGWLEVEKSITQSCAATVHVLLGQAFFQTEPQLVLRLRNLKESGSSPHFDVKLAPANSTFHPKVWIV